jgi:hypothetical protein
MNVNTIENRNIGSDNAPSSHFDPASDGLLRMRKPDQCSGKIGATYAWNRLGRARQS